MLTIPRDAPQTLEEYEYLVNAVYQNGIEQYNIDTEKAVQNANSQWDKLVDKKREHMIADMEANLAVNESISDTQYKAEWNKGIKDINAKLDGEYSQFIAQAKSMVEIPQTIEQIENIYGFYKLAILERQKGVDHKDFVSFTSDCLCRLNDGQIYSVAEAKFVPAQSGQRYFVVNGGVNELKSILEWHKENGFPDIKIGIELLTLGEYRQSKLQQLKEAFSEAEENSKIMSSAGFEIDANEVANRNINGLITEMEDSDQQSTTFCDAHNEFHTVSLAQLKTMRLEVIRYGQSLYHKKWEIRKAINTATSKQQLESIIISL